jgi:hypothetical protein
MQQGVCPAAMGLPDGPESPLVFNFGYRGSVPAFTALNVSRVLDAGVRPDFVLAEFAPDAMSVEQYGSVLVRNWANRFTARDVRWLATNGFLDPGIPGTGRALGRWAVTAAAPWSSHRLAILSHWLPNWVSLLHRVTLGTEPMDRYGYTPSQYGTVTPAEFRARHLETIRKHNASARWRTEIAPSVVRAHAALVDRCRAEGIPVAFVWAPMAPFLKAWMPPELGRAAAEYAERLTRDSGVPVFPPPDWVTDDDLPDGSHLYPPSAERYSRWLADTHLKPWLARQGVTK